MPSRPTSFRLLRSLVLVLLLIFGGILSDNAPGAPAPRSNPYALLYIPKKISQHETTQYRRRQITLLRTNSVPFVLFWAIRSLKETDLPSLPKKGKGGENRHNNEEDIAWLAQNLKLEYLDGTGVLRISLAAGSRREQALLINAVVHAYFQLEVDIQKRHHERGLERHRSLMKMRQEEFETAHGAHKRNLERSIVEDKASIKWCEEALRTLPRLLELAEVPPE
jgi:hypothetical protein